ncbi:hypothetical protein [Streptomyces sp. NPDC045251]
MSTDRLTHRERLALICSAVSGAMAGVTRAVMAWLLDRMSS